MAQYQLIIIGPADWVSVRVKPFTPWSHGRPRREAKETAAIKVVDSKQPETVVASPTRRVKIG